MSLDQIQLTPGLISELYSKILTEIKETDAGLRKQSPEESEWNYIGENGKKILLLVNYPEQVQLTNMQFSFINNMLSACKISLQDVVLMNRTQNVKANHKKLIEYFQSKIILLFGIEPDSFGLPLNFPHFQVQNFSNCTFLFIPAIEDLENDKVLKSKLWVCLRRIFGI